MGLNFSPSEFTRTFEWHFTLDKFTAEVPFFDTTLVFEPPVTYALTLGVFLTYLLCILVIFRVVKPKDDKTRETIAFYHNVALCIYSFIAFAATFYYMLVNNEFYDTESFLCKPIPGWLRFLSITFTISKIWEWIDTAIFIWRGKSLYDIGFLHLYHHATTFILFLVVANAPGTEKYGMLFNGFVHTLMYYHYAFRLPKPLRPVITIAQIIQLFSATYIWYVICETCPGPMAEKLLHPFEYITPYIFVPVYGLFFVRFFFQEYICKKSTSKKVTQKKAE